MQASRAAKRNQREVARIVPALYRDHSQRALHGGVRNGNDPLGQFERLLEFGSLPAPISSGESRTGQGGRDGRCGSKAGESLLGGFDVKPEGAAEKALGVEPPQNKVGVGDRGAIPAFAVTRGSGLGAGAFGADAQ